MTDEPNVTELISEMLKSDRDIVHQMTELVLQMVRVLGTVSIMPSEAMPLSGILVHVHPKVYLAVRARTREIEARNDTVDAFMYAFDSARKEAPK